MKRIALSALSIVRVFAYAIVVTATLKPQQQAAPMRSSRVRFFRGNRLTASPPLHRRRATAIISRNRRGMTVIPVHHHLPLPDLSKLDSLSYPSGSTIYLKAGDTWNAGTTLTLSTSHVTGSLTVTTYGGGTCNVIAGTTSGCATLQASGSQANGATITGLSNFTIEHPTGCASVPPLIATCSSTITSATTTAIIRSSTRWPRSARSITTTITAPAQRRLIRRHMAAPTTHRFRLGRGQETIHGMTANPSLTSPGGGSTCYPGFPG